MSLAMHAPACADASLLPIIDEAFARPGGDAAKWMKSHLCRRCPAARECFNEAMNGEEHGVWGGTSPTARSRAKKRADGR